MTHDHLHPGPAEGRAAMLVALAVPIAVLNGRDRDAIRAAAEAPCPTCLLIALNSLWVNILARDHGDGPLPEPVRARLLATLTDIATELRGQPN